MARPAGFTDTVRVPGIVPVAGETLSQPEPVVVVTVALQVTVFEAVIDTLWDAIVVPVDPVNVKVFVLIESSGAAATLRVTFTVWLPSPVAVKLIVPK